MTTSKLCLDCLNELEIGDVEGELICSFCRQKFILEFTLVKIESYLPDYYIEPHEDDPYP